MTKTIVVCGYGPGISAAVARKFGSEGFRVALVSRSATKLEQAVVELTQAGIEAKAFPCDLADPEAITKLIADVRDKLGPIHTIHWNAYAGQAGDLTTCEVAELRAVFDVAITGAVVAVQRALPDLEASRGSVLITGGGFAYYSDEADKQIAEWNAMGLALMKAAQYKLAGVLHHKLASKGVFVGSVVILGIVKGSAFDSGGGSLDPAEIANAFWRLGDQRDAIHVDYPARSESLDRP